MIISFGEILLDVFENKNTKKEVSFVGGAPFNVAYQAHEMGNPTLFVGNIGKDEAGKKILRFFNDKNLDQRGLNIDPKRKTTIAKVTLNKAERSFTFSRENTADAFFSEDSLDFIASGDVIHVGSLMLSSKEGRDFASKIISFSKAQKKTLSFDINYRKDLFSSEKEAKTIYEEFYPQFDIVKFSREELNIFTKENDVEKAVKELKQGPKIILVTLGKDGCLAFFKNKSIKVKSIKVNSIDTTGAGDAFLGTFLSNVDSLGLSEIMFIPSLMESTLKFCNIAGALATTKMGAIASIPSYKEVNETLEKNTFSK